MTILPCCSHQQYIQKSSPKEWHLFTMSSDFQDIHSLKLLTSMYVRNQYTLNHSETFIIPFYRTNNYNAWSHLHYFYFLSNKKHYEVSNWFLGNHIYLFFFFLITSIIERIATDLTITNIFQTAGWYRRIRDICQLSNLLSQCMIAKPNNLSPPVNILNWIV